MQQLHSGDTTSSVWGDIMTIENIASRVDRYINLTGKSGATHATGLRNLTVTCHRQPTAKEVALASPSFCLILQGSQKTEAAASTTICKTGQSRILGLALLATNEITEASEKSPFLSLNLTLDLAVLRGLYDQIGDRVFDDIEGVALESGAPDDALIDAIGRYFALVDRPWESDVMGPLLLRELHFRLLIAPHGGILRQLLIRDSHASRVARVIGRIRQGFRKPMNIAEMAKVAGMSESAFYGHFKTITGTTPLQYQKDLRLIEARRLILAGKNPIASAARAVGYDSATQFSREYARKFGASPSSYIGGIRVSV